MRQYTWCVCLLAIVLSACTGKITPSVVESLAPDCFPDYNGVTVPYNIAPLNFKPMGNFSKVQAEIIGEKGGLINIKNNRYVKMPLRKWKKLLEQNKGASLQVSVSVKTDKGWVKYAPFPIHVSANPIDFGLAYRLVAPGYEVFSKMGIYQRSLSDFKQTPVYENTLVAGSCVNCHSFKTGDTGFMNMHLRGSKGGTVLLHEGNMKLLHTKTDKTMSNFVYPYWHPSGNYVAYSVNNTHQVFHATTPKRVEVLDFASDILVYDVLNNQAILSPRLMSENRFETFPVFSADGNRLFFCVADSASLPTDFKQVRYNLCSVAFNPADGTFGDTIDTLFNAVEIGKSVTFPRPSPDGRFIMFTLAEYGNFSIWHPEADLWLLDLATGQVRPMDEVNSSDTESYHSWSSCSNWFVFSSRRVNGLYTMPFIASIDEKGNAGKPFLLPQKDIDYYDWLMFSFNIPEFINSKIKLNIRQLEKKLNEEQTAVKVREVY